ncbi:MAG TPA: LacI family DNA-binding transcriptional regulator [Chondromyces sp.]|nr:LacI family DNA-binding transcriptional regulator [Chondromyces sp.]
MANIEEIAKLANVSVTTVSRVLNNHPYVKKEKREAILKAMEKCNYQKNINAVHLKKGKTFQVGVVVPYTNHSYFGLLVDGIASEALEHDYNIVLIQTNYREEVEIQALNMLRHKQIDALIICSRECSMDIINDYVSYGPIVLCEDKKETNVSSIFIDQYKSFFKALEFLYENGHTDIGYCIARRTGTNSNRRAKAYEDFMASIGKPFRPDYIFEDCLYFEDGEKVVKRIKELTAPPTALLVTSDQVAAGIITCCNNEGIIIPDQLAIVGFDNEPIAKVMNITTIDIPLKSMGKKLFSHAVNEKGIVHEEIEVTLIKRQTV